MTMIQETCVQTLRFLAADEVEKAKSGHPGFPLGTAPLMFTLWDKFMRYNPADPKWFNRDRFVLSPGHGSALCPRATVRRCCTLCCIWPATKLP